MLNTKTRYEMSTISNSKYSNYLQFYVAYIMCEFQSFLLIYYFSGVKDHILGCFTESVFQNLKL